MNSSDYSDENKSNYKGALKTRIESLCTGLNGIVFCDETNSDVSLSTLFENNVIIVSRRIEKEYFSKAISYCKENGATVTDLLLASFIDALSKISNIKPDEKISVACATDLRRHIKDLSTLGYTNHVSFVHCSLDKKGSDLKDTLKSVSAKMKENKADEFMGLHGLPLLNFAYKRM